jgi:hypothetical protein
VASGVAVAADLGNGEAAVGDVRCAAWQYHLNDASEARVVEPPVAPSAHYY